MCVSYVSYSLSIFNGNKRHVSKQAQSMADLTAKSDDSRYVCSLYLAHSAHKLPIRMVRFEDPACGHVFQRTNAYHIHYIWSKYAWKSKLFGHKTTNTSFFAPQLFIQKPNNFCNQLWNPWKKKRNESEMKRARERERDEEEEKRAKEEQSVSRSERHDESSKINGIWVQKKMLYSRSYLFFSAGFKFMKKANIHVATLCSYIMCITVCSHKQIFWN